MASASLGLDQPPSSSGTQPYLSKKAALLTSPYERRSASPAAMSRVAEIAEHGRLQSSRKTAPCRKGHMPL
eukprot:2201944-Prymnesium_polylepis.1